MVRQWGAAITIMNLPARKAIVFFNRTAFFLTKIWHIHANRHCHHQHYPSVLKTWSSNHLADKILNIIIISSMIIIIIHPSIIMITKHLIMLREKPSCSVVGVLTTRLLGNALSSSSSSSSLSSSKFSSSFLSSKWLQCHFCNRFHICAFWTWKLYCCLFNVHLRGKSSSDKLWE